MEIRALRAHDDAEFRRFHEIYTAAEGFERPWASLRALEDLRVEVMDDDPAERNEAFVAVERDEIVGAGIAYFPMTDNTHLSWFYVWVEPEYRRRGIGSAVLERLMDRAREDGRSELVLETAIPFQRREDHPYRRFAEDHGYRLAITEVRRHLELPVDEGFLDRLITESALHHPSYRIETFDGPIPDELLASLCACRNRLSVDAPSGEFFFEQERSTPEIVRAHEEMARKQGRTLLTTLAISQDGDVVGYNDLVILAPPNPNVSQWGTLVLPEHRGHRLGMAMKARGLRELQTRIGPHVVRVSTSNAETNGYMVGINERLGFRPVEVSPGFLYRTTEHEAPAAGSEPRGIPAALSGVPASGS